MMPPLHRLARKMCRIYFQGLSVRRKEPETDYVEREWRAFVPMAAAALEEMGATMVEMARER